MASPLLSCFVPPVPKRRFARLPVRHRFYASWITGRIIGLRLVLLETVPADSSSRHPVFSWSSSRARRCWSAILQRALRTVARVVDQVLSLPHIDKAAGDDVRSGDQLAGCGRRWSPPPRSGRPRPGACGPAARCCRRRPRPGRPPCTAPAGTVPDNAACCRRSVSITCADVRDEDVSCVDAHLLWREPACLCRCLYSPCTGMKNLGLVSAMHQLQLLLAGVAGDVHLVHLFIDHLRAQLHQLVDHPADSLLVAGDGVRGDDDKVVRRRPRPCGGRSSPCG